MITKAKPNQTSVSYSNRLELIDMFSFYSAYTFEYTSYLSVTPNKL